MGKKKKRTACNRCLLKLGETRNSGRLRCRQAHWTALCRKRKVTTLYSGLQVRARRKEGSSAAKGHERDLGACTSKTPTFCHVLCWNGSSVRRQSLDCRISVASLVPHRHNHTDLQDARLLNVTLHACPHR